MYKRVVYAAKERELRVQHSNWCEIELTCCRLFPLLQGFPPRHQPVRSGVEQDVSGSDQLRAAGDIQTEAPHSMLFNLPFLLLFLHFPLPPSTSFASSSCHRTLFSTTNLKLESPVSVKHRQNHHLNYSMMGSNLTPGFAILASLLEEE